MCPQYFQRFAWYPQNRADLSSISGVLLRKCDFIPADEGVDD